MTTTSTPDSAVRQPPPTRQWTLSAAVTALLVLTVALVLGGGGSGGPVPGLTDAGALTRWGLPTSRLAEDAAATVTVGFLLLAVLLPAVKGELGRNSLRALRIAAVSAVVWALATLAVHLLTLSDLVGLPLPEALAGDSLLSFTTDVEQGRALALVVILALAVAASAVLTIGRGGAWAVLLLGIGALIPPALTGHSSTGDYHHSAAISLIVHIVGIALWVGGLIAVSWYAAQKPRDLPTVVSTFSAVALGCYVAVVASGVLNAYVRLQSPADLVTTEYGLLLLVKVTLVVVLGWLGYTHRSRTLVALRAGRSGAFRRLAAGEVVVMAATIALGVALSRTPPPVPEDPGQLTRARELLGFVPPPEISPGRIFTEWYPDAVFAIGCLGAVLLYLGGVWRLRQRGDRWPVGRTVSWLLGVAVIAFATLSGAMTYGMVMISVHMVQHMVLSMIAPVLLVLGGPVTLALRAIAPARRGERGAREVILSVAQSPVVRFLTHPVVAWILFVSATFTIYFTPLFEYAMRNHYAHLAMQLHFIVVGYLFAEVLVGIDPLPKRPPYPARVVMQFGAMAFHAFFGIAFMNWQT